MRVLLVSTYELGHQPLGIAGPAGALAAAGHETLVADLAVQEWPAEQVAVADAAVVSVPMHTATRLSLPAIRRLRSEAPGLRLALHGLYAPVLAGHALLSEDDLLLAGEPMPALLDWLEGRRPGGLVKDLGSARPGRSPAPRRVALPPLERYARFRTGGREVLAAGVEASRGCNHRCGHCPVAAVYGGRSRAVPADTVLEDVAQVVAAGARHVSFADPDFLNRPRHALHVARRLRDEHGGELTFDATVKVEHICRHAGVFEELAAAGLSFVVSAFESVDDTVLGLLDKGHTVADEIEALQIVRSAGIELRPSWLPFTPWTGVQSFGDLLCFVARHDLLWSTDPVQYSIRLLLPRGSLLLRQPDPILAASLGAPDPDTGSVGWQHADPAMDSLWRSVAAAVEEAGGGGPSGVAAVAEDGAGPGGGLADIEEAFATLWRLARAAGAFLPPEPPAPETGRSAPVAGPERPRLTESWFCCAEPTSAQLAFQGAEAFAGAGAAAGGAGAGLCEGAGCPVRCGR